MLESQAFISMSISMENTCQISKACVTFKTSKTRANTLCYQPHEEDPRKKYLTTWNQESRKMIWFNFLGVCRKLFPANTLVEWLTEIRNELNISKVIHKVRWNMVLLTWWHIRKSRCKFAFEGKLPTPWKSTAFYEKHMSTGKNHRESPIHNWDPRPVFWHCRQTRLSS